jgi:hypothetical protein
MLCIKVYRKKWNTHFMPTVFFVMVQSEVTVWVIKFLKFRMFDKTHGTSMCRCLGGNRLVEISGWRRLLRQSTRYMTTPSLWFSWMNCITWDLYTNQSVTPFHTVFEWVNIFVFFFWKVCNNYAKPGQSHTGAVKLTMQNLVSETNNVKLTLTNTLWSS